MFKNNVLLIVPVSLDEISIDWSKTNAPLHIKKLAEYYSIYEHLFGDAYFTPYIQMDISYDYNSKNIPIYRGNIIKPEEVIILKIFCAHSIYSNFISIGCKCSGC